MANEAAVTIVARMRDEASGKMANLGKTTQTTTVNMNDLRMTLTAVGSALVGIGSLLGKLDNPAAKMASNFFLIGGAIGSTAGAILNVIPYIGKLITWLRNLAVVQTIVKALSGPVGWAQLGIGLGLAAVGTAAVIGLSGGFSNQSAGTASRGGTTVNINSQAFAGNDAEARKFASKVQRYSREEARLGR